MFTCSLCTYVSFTLFKAEYSSRLRLTSPLIEANMKQISNNKLLKNFIFINFNISMKRNSYLVLTKFFCTVWSNQKRTTKYLFIENFNQSKHFIFSFDTFKKISKFDSIIPLIHHLNPISPINHQHLLLMDFL